jgi:prevent-host-death family protein
MLTNLIAGHIVRLTYAIEMSTLTASEARAKLYRLIDEAAESHIPIRITGKRNSTVLISEKDWASVQEAMYLLSIPGMRKSIREGMDSPCDSCPGEFCYVLKSRSNLVQPADGRNP